MRYRDMPSWSSGKMNRLKYKARPYLLLLLLIIIGGLFYWYYFIKCKNLGDDCSTISCCGDMICNNNICVSNNYCSSFDCPSNSQAKEDSESIYCGDNDCTVLTCCDYIKCGDISTTITCDDNHSIYDLNKIGNTKEQCCSPNKCKTWINEGNNCSTTLTKSPEIVGYSEEDCCFDATWYLGEVGESCDDVCMGQDKHCHLGLSEINTENSFKALIDYMDNEDIVCNNYSESNDNNSPYISVQLDGCHWTNSIHDNKRITDSGIKQDSCFGSNSSYKRFCKCFDEPYKCGEWFSSGVSECPEGKTQQPAQLLGKSVEECCTD